MAFILDPRADLATLTRQLVDIPSVSGDEGPIASAVEAYLRGLADAGAHGTPDAQGTTGAHSIPGTQGGLEIVRDGDTVMARTQLGCASRVILAGHLDTVPIDGNLPSTLRDDTIFGRGSADMKGGVAVFLALAAALTDPDPLHTMPQHPTPQHPTPQKPTHDITWIFYDHEEVAAHLSGLARVAKNYPDWLTADIAILGEPTAAQVEAGCNGSVRIILHTHGTAAHSARAWMGENAIHAAAPILERLAAFQPRSVRVEGLEYREGLNAVKASGGIANNVIPDEFSVTVNYRHAPDTSSDEALAFLAEFFTGFDFDVDDVAPPAAPGLNTLAVGSFLDIAAQHGAGAPLAKEGWTDVARFAQMGIPALNFGPGDPAVAHSANENCPTQQIRAVFDVLDAWLTR